MGELAIRKDYLLSEAFETLGKHIYGSEWSGQEYRQEEVSAPEELRKVREPHERELMEVEDRLTALDDEIAKTTSPKSVSALGRRKTALEKQINKINLTLFQLPLDNEVTGAAFHNYERKQTVEQMIVTALREGLLQAHNGRQEPIHQGVWSGARGFCYSFELSMAVLPRSASPPSRREHVQITEESFKKWIDMNSPRTASAEAELSPEDRCRLWLTRIFSDHPQPHDIRKVDLMAKAVREIHGLRKRAFARAWDAVAPKSFKKGGRRSRAKSMQR